MFIKLVKLVPSCNKYSSKKQSSITLKKCQKFDRSRLEKNSFITFANLKFSSSVLHSCCSSNKPALPLSYTEDISYLDISKLPNATQECMLNCKIKDTEKKAGCNLKSALFTSILGPYTSKINS